MASPAPAGPSSDGSPLTEVAAEVPFYDMCGLMERVQKMSGLEKKKRILASFLDKWREEHNRLHPTDADTTVSCNFNDCSNYNPPHTRDLPTLERHFLPSHASSPPTC